MSFGQDDLETMLSAGDLELCSVSIEGATALIAKARVHHQTAAGLANTDPEIALDALHAGNRKALDAVLLARGLRATKDGGHIATEEAVRATLGGGRLPALRVYSVVRRARHEADYESATVDARADDVEDNLDDSAALVDACEKLIDSVPPFTPGRR